MRDEELFSSDLKKVDLGINILDVKLVDVAEQRVSPTDVSGLILQASSLSDVEDLGKLKRRMMEFIHINAVNQTPITLQNLNRRFGRAAKRFGSTAADIVQMLVAAERVTWFDWNGIRALYSKTVWDEYCVKSVELNLNIGEIRDNILRNTQ